MKYVLSLLIVITMASDPLATKDDCRQCPVKLWENQCHQKLSAKNMQTMGSQLNPVSFAEYTGQLIPVPQG